MVDADDKVGYKQPPKRTQFQKGTSGNLKGRPRKPRDLASITWDALGKKAVVTENGVLKRKMKLEIFLTQLINKASTADMRAIKLLLDLMRAYPDPRAASQPVNGVLTIAMIDAIMNAHDAINAHDTKEPAKKP